MMLEGAQSRIWCSKIGWQTVPCSWCIHGEAALTNGSPGTRDQQSPRRRGTQLTCELLIHIIIHLRHIWHYASLSPLHIGNKVEFSTVDFVEPATNRQQS